MRSKLFFVLFILFNLFNAQNTSFYGKVIRVIDGDTILIVGPDNKEIKIRLYGIDCPESKQEFGDKATQFVRELIDNKEVKVVSKGTDIYKRTLAIVFKGKENINEKLLSKGLAWQYKYNKNPKYKKLVETAKKQKLNIWSKKNPISPWDYRKQKKKIVIYNFINLPCSGKIKFT